MYYLQRHSIWEGAAGIHPNGLSIGWYRCRGIHGIPSRWIPPNDHLQNNRHPVDTLSEVIPRISRSRESLDLGHSVPMVLNHQLLGLNTLVTGPVSNPLCRGLKGDTGHNPLQEGYLQTLIMAHSEAIRRVPRPNILDIP